MLFRSAVNLGGDTDTIGAIAGGLAALHYGYNNIPEEWKTIIIKREEIITLCELVEREKHKSDEKKREKVE